jgi:transposase
MGTTFRPYDPDQQLLLPQDLREWVPAGHLAHHVSDLVDSADLSSFYARYEGDGRRRSPYEPRMMVKLLVYGYATGVFSSRKLARKLEEDLALRMLAAGNFPAHRTLCEFRKKNLEAFGALFADVVRLARELGLARLSRVAVDGTKVRANASKRKAMSYGRMEPEEARLEAEVAELLAAAEAVDAEEDERYGEDVRGDELPEELKRREDRLAAIRAAKARLEEAARERDDARGRRPEWDRNPKGGSSYKLKYGEPEAKDQANFTDPESRIMRTSTEGYQQCYNAQAVVDGESQLVLGAAVTDNASDQGQLAERVDEVSGRCGETPGEVLADSGYCNEEDLAALEARGIDGYVALGREGGAAGEPDPEKLPATARMAKRLATPEGRAVYAKRKWIAEAPIGWIKEAMGFRRFSLRGLENVRGEWDLVCLALNVRRLHVLRTA